MSETDLTIYSDSSNKIQVDATQIRGEGGVSYPRLIIPTKLNLNPLNNQNYSKQFTILGIQSDLFLQKHQFKFADATVNFNPYNITYNNANITYMVEFHLDAYRVRMLEDQRTGADLTLRIDYRFLLGLYSPISRIGQQKPIDALTNVISSNVTLSVEIPKSHWVEKILPQLGYIEYFLIEIPKGGKEIQAAWEYLKKAENALARWDTKAVFVNCRELGVLLDRTTKDKFGASNFVYVERWGRAYAQFNNFSSLDLHLEDIKKSSKYSSEDVRVLKHDADHLLLVAKSLVKYAEELLQEGV